MIHLYWHKVSTVWHWVVGINAHRLSLPVRQSPMNRALGLLSPSSKAPPLCTLLWSHSPFPPHALGTKCTEQRSLYCATCMTVGQSAISFMPPSPLVGEFLLSQDSLHTHLEVHSLVSVGRGQQLQHYRITLDLQDTLDWWITWGTYVSFYLWIPKAWETIGISLKCAAVGTMIRHGTKY